VRHAGSEGLALETLTGVQDARRRLRAVACCARLGRGQAPQRLLRQVEAVGEQPQGLLALRRVLGLCEHFTSANEAFLPIGCALDLEPHAVEEVALGSLEPELEATRIVGRVLSRRKRHDLHVEPLGGRELHPPQRRSLPRRIRVEAQVELARLEPCELANLLSCERRPHRRDDWLEARLPQRDDVGVPLDHGSPVLLRDRFPCEVQSVDDRSLVEEVAFR
jgi:hypothetical protein